MINTSRQLKDKIKNLSGGNSLKAQTLIRKYVMERFLARVAQSKYQNNFILKGGMLISAIVGEDARSTMDIDTTVQSLPLTNEDIQRIINEVASIDLGDNLTFTLSKTETIRDDFDYPGVRVTLKVIFEKLKETVNIDISTGDEITPSAVQFTYPMMFEQEKIRIWSYNLETLMAEKIQTVLARSVTNTRMRDFYDIYILWNLENDSIDRRLLRDAYKATAHSRSTEGLINDAEPIMEDIAISEHMEILWDNYKKSNSYVGDLSWNDVLDTVTNIVLDEIKYDTKYEIENEDDEIEDEITEDPQSEIGHEMTML